ncbi:hypothetical protein ACSRUE_22460 [Sorangium sp. KYC3313]|uniref:hypothetical protein n=1 Tax=Sorangium sp. KYC3313 TaxID=3449740 RepID=UPI003F8AC200
MKRIPRTPRLQRVQCTRRTLQFKHHLGVELAGDKETVFLIGERERTMPGLRHFWPRFGPGRLYDVPVRLGWLERANREEDLNPVPLVV